MAGHSHWAGIKHKKARVDAQRGKIFSKLSKLLMQAARDGSDPEYNFKLRRAMEKAQAYNMPKDRIENAVKKGAGEIEGYNLAEVVYEGYSADGIAVMVEAITENTNRTTPEIRHIFEHRNGSLGAPGSVAWKFVTRGLFVVTDPGMEEEEFLDLVIEAGIDDYAVGRDGTYELYAAVDSFGDVKDVLDGRSIGFSAEITKVPKSPVPVTREQYLRVMGLIEELEDHDDVQEVYADFDVSDEVLGEVEKKS